MYMKLILKFFTSLKTTIVLTIIIILVCGIGSFQILRNPDIYTDLGFGILIPWFFKQGVKHLSSTWWLPILVSLLALIGLNTIICTTDRLIRIKNNSRAGFLKALHPYLPHLVHIGFLIGLTGHLIGNSYGFKTTNNIVFRGEMKKVPHSQRLKLELNDVKEVIEDGMLRDIQTSITLYDGDKVIRKGVIEVNKPLIYNGIAFYHRHHSTAPYGYILDIRDVSDTPASPLGDKGEKIIPIRFGGQATLTHESTIVLGRLYPDFAMNKDGIPYTRSNLFQNPVQELFIYSKDKRKIRLFLPVGTKGTSIEAGRFEIELKDYLLKPFVVLDINYNPGVPFVFTGSLISVVGVFSLLFIRGEGGLIRNRSLRKSDTSKT